ncbi:LTXXQ motif family protein [Methylophilus rhizosphaerae]|uniref:LTXXQ motif family protein n=2 Tax=Methylophilus rhizosphaerae TaxID=492660 RepID=A0A1G9B5F8_9PROT|nr:LTXXQ motif family protein [Methylophilus rhizosphaerae]
MKLRKLAIAGALILMSGAAFADQGHGCGKGHFSKANWQEHRQEFFQKHQERLHTVLQLTAAQENAWKTYQDQIKPEVKTEHPDRQAFAKLTTPERLDKLEAWDKSRDAHTAQRDKAIRTFYAQLNDAQKKVFDENAFPHRDHGKPHRK